MKIWIDADACPVAIREILFRTAERLRIETTLVANQSIAIAKSAFIRRVTVRDGADMADDRIVELMQRGDLVITNDIPLASRVVEKEGVAISPRGELFDDKSVHERLAARNLMEQFRSAGFETGGPKPLSQKDVQTFANQLDRSLTRMLQRNKDEQ
ncbi:MAG: YaiI/YqxD family protein [Planctomycetota bacterium]|nr:YaiI/YqxD family protein [Planctomycetota bacterium]